MNHAEMQDLLTVLGGLDHFHAVNDQTKLAEKADSWLLILDGCEYDDALSAIRTYYLDANRKPITPAVIRMFCQRLAVSRQLEHGGYPAGRNFVPVTGKPKWFDKAVDECKKELTANPEATEEELAAIVTSVREEWEAEHPEPVNTTYKVNERACSSPECLCTHTVCFNGLLDHETDRERDGQKYKTVVRCPQCKDALDARAGVA